ncbi:MAG: hypothetical protein LBV43_12115 [Prevotella sp.]|jgi:hypothetical protein|nr:hypothetical protein [Prevotella sp.]
MRIKNALRGGDLVYRVDPSKLSIKVFKISSKDEMYNFATTTYENFSIECEKKRFQLPFGDFPFEFRGLWYFLTEDDAKDFIKAQIGM